PASLPLARPSRSPLFTYSTLFRSRVGHARDGAVDDVDDGEDGGALLLGFARRDERVDRLAALAHGHNEIAFTHDGIAPAELARRSEEHTSELQSRENLVWRLLLEK